jgi:hypothetical protein
MATYDRNYEICGIALPDELFGMFDTGDVLNILRRYGLAIALFVAVVGVVWVVRYEWAERERSERYAPVAKAKAEVLYLQDHHGTDEEICSAQQKLVEAENEALVGDGNDLDHLIARTCATNLQLKARLDTGY